MAARIQKGQRAKGQKDFWVLCGPVQMAKLDLQWTGMAGVGRRRPDYRS